MAEYIMVTKAEFEAAFEACQKALELQKFRNRDGGPLEPNDDMHRSFNFHMYKLRSRLMGGE